MSTTVTSVITRINSRPQLTLVASARSYRAMTNTELVVACQRRDRQAFDCLLKRHERAIAGMLYRLSADSTDNSDIIQEASIKVWRSITRLRNPSSFNGWLTAIVTNAFYDAKRKHCGKFRLVSLDEPYIRDGIDCPLQNLADCSPLPEDKALANELCAVLNKALSRLTSQFRTAIILRDVDGLSYEQIARITHTELGTVKSRISRARHQVQPFLIPYLRTV